MSQPGEILDLKAAGVRRLGYSYRGSRRTDEHGNLFRYWSKAWILDAAKRERVIPTVDVFFALPEP